MSSGEAGRVPAGIALDNWLSAPYSQWSFQHVEELLPTAVISRGTGPAAALPVARAPVAEIPVICTDGVAATVGAVMATTATDGWAVAHRGSMVAEEYLNGMAAQTRHLLFSVSKSLVAAVVGALHGAGAIELDAPVTAFVPALANCGYAGATVRHLLDMRSGIAFSENYRDPTAEIHIHDQAVGWAPRSSSDVPATLQDFLLTLRKKSAHGGPFEYRSCETGVLGWICEVAGGQRMPDLMSELLWSRIGAQCDATICVDSVGTGLFDGGINACLTDMIRFGSLFLRDGVSLTEQHVVPAAWIADTIHGGPDSRQAFSRSDDTPMPGGMYRNQVWLPYPGSNVVLCQGMCGQMIYVNRAAEVVAAKLSSQPHSPDPDMLLDTLRAFDAVAHELAGITSQPEVPRTWPDQLRSPASVMRDASPMESYRRDHLIFDVRDAGPPDGPVVVLLHGFPQHNDSWNAVIDRLTAQGYRCLAPNQRGYSPGARPSRRRDYRMAELVADVGALIDASGARRVHLVGHDWGAAVAWGVAAEMPERLLTVSPVSVPHPAAFVKSFATSLKGLASWYMFFFQLPWFPERLLTRRNGARIAKALQRTGQAPVAAQRDAQAMSQPGALTAGINWYRALPLSDVRDINQKISVPTMYVWSDQDTALLPRAAHDTARYVSGEYRFEILPGVPHWIPDVEPDKLADLLLDWFAAHPAN